MLVLVRSGVRAGKVLCLREAQVLCEQITKGGRGLAGGEDAAGTTEIRKWLPNSATTPDLALGRPDPAPSSTDNTFLGFLRSVTP